MCIVTRQQRIPYTLPFNASYPSFCEDNSVSERIPHSSFVLPFQDTLSITHFPKPMYKTHSCGLFFLSLSQDFSVYAWPPVFNWWLFSTSLTKNSHSHFLYTPPHRNKSVSWLMETLSCQSLCFVPLLPLASPWELRRCREVIKL